MNQNKHELNYYLVLETGGVMADSKMSCKITPEQYRQLKKQFFPGVCL